MIPDEAVVAAAAAIQVRMDRTVGLNDLARAALEAAAPHILQDMRPMTLVEIADRDRPEGMAVARAKVRAERAESQKERFRAAREAAWDQGMADMARLMAAGPGYEMGNPYRVPRAEL